MKEGQLLAQKVRLNVKKNEKTEEDPDWRTKRNKQKSLAKKKLQREMPKQYWEEDSD